MREKDGKRDVNMPSRIRVWGHLLLWTGFLAGAFLSVRRTEVPGAPWSTISWPAYGAALLVAGAGVVLLRTTRRASAVAAGEEAGAVEELAAILDRLHATVQQWYGAFDTTNVYRFHEMIDGSLAEDLARFADLREALIAHFDLDHYARVMTEFALAERTVNRIWSASADGYVDEVRTCLQRALGHLANARQRLSEGKG